ncbi:acyl-CoA dehydratase activase [Methanorbis furvi]|uniref:(R)-2-hydroxyglutaryl-CoA dehydratase activating ATPase n=1 Tax=Methanorbis furvi TaxID=3028299 RepID=A0AAE4SA73_9EURY|nr:(R)-2-hydroxyglutaryl-CoA dehydratase activating ATPase [Methanocorpusculaceae archaeon Ag1]
MIYSLGVDAGSRYTKFALMRGDKILDLRMVPSGWNTKELVREITDELCAKHGISRSDLKITATGYGRVAVEADSAVTEITCHALGVHYLNPDVRTVIDIGGQDSKVIVCGADGSVVDFIMNDKCAAGTGKFLEMMLETLGATFATLDDVVRDAVPIRITSTCAVFAESEVIGLRAKGADRAEILAGVIAATADKAAGLCARVRVADTVFFSGGLASSEAVRAALAERLGREVVTTPEAQYAGAIGAAVKGGML